MHQFHVTTFVAGLLFAAGLYGCAGSSVPEPSGTPQTVTNQPAVDVAGVEHSEHAHQGEAKTMGGMEGLNELSEADRASAMKQHVCPVSDQMLGGMGAPIKVTVKDRDVWLCCESCKEALEADPDKYLAKLDK